jgi:hypothetical protein
VIVGARAPGAGGGRGHGDGDAAAPPTSPRAGSLGLFVLRVDHVVAVALAGRAAPRRGVTPPRASASPCARARRRGCRWPRGPPSRPLRAWSRRRWRSCPCARGGLLHLVGSSRRTCCAPRPPRGGACPRLVRGGLAHERSTSSFERPEPAVMVIFWLRPGGLVLGRDIEMMPLASMSKVTRIFGTPCGAGGMPSRTKRPRSLVVAGHGALALEHVHLHLRLAVAGGGEHLALRRRDGGVARDEHGS